MGYRYPTCSEELIADLLASRRQLKSAEELWLWEQRVSVYLGARSFSRAAFYAACEREGLPLDDVKRWAGE